MEQTGELGMAGRERGEAVVQTMASPGSRVESLAEVAHEARNMVTALGLYCDLLEEPGVLAVPFAHYGIELRLVAAANLAAELLANRNLLSALAGPGIVVTVDAEGGARPVRLTAEDVTRLLVNLVKNAAEAIPAKAGRGHIQISLRERSQGSGDPEVPDPQVLVPEMLVLAVEDNGPGIPLEVVGKIFDSGFSTRARNTVNSGGWPVAHRGLGLAISRSIIEASGGRVVASNRAQGGARIEIELPVRLT
jgi:signal transduction histidine kinase